MNIVDLAAQKEFERLGTQELSLVLDRFSRADALQLGLNMLEKAKAFPDPIAVEITINGLVVFRHFTDGSIADSEFWLSRKRNSVELMAMSSLRFKAWLSMYGLTLTDRKLDPNHYTIDGGCIPIVIKGTGMIGTVCVSGLPNDLNDHQVVVDALLDLINRA